jgi:hypothetical protein
MDSLCGASMSSRLAVQLAASGDSAPTTSISPCSPWFCVRNQGNGTFPPRAVDELRTQDAVFRQVLRGAA